LPPTHRTFGEKNHKPTEKGRDKFADRDDLFLAALRRHFAASPRLAKLTRPGKISRLSVDGR